VDGTRWVLSHGVIDGESENGLCRGEVICGLEDKVNQKAMVSRN